MGEGLDYTFGGVLSAARPAAESTRVLGEYRLVRKLGEGGMAQVFLAKHLRTSEKVALKVLHPHFAKDPHRVAQLRSEANVLGQIGHENVVKVLGMREELPFPFMVMEFLEGLPLTKLMGKPMDSQVAIPILVQVCGALEAAHRRGVIHRDLKPDNIFLVPRRGGIPRVKLLDFGLATHMSVDGVPPGDGAVGTARFMAPEQWEGRALDVRTDLYALGVIAFGLATGQPPFTERNEDDLRWAHCYWPAPDPRTVCAGVSDSWAQVIIKALSKDPKDRYQSGRELSQALEAALEDEGPTLVGVLAEPSPITPLFDSVDPEVERVLARYRGLPDGDPYAVLDLPEGARTGEVWRAGGKRLSELSALSEKRLPPELRDELARARARVLRALCQLGLPHRRIGQDAAAGNLAGVARCIAAMGRSATLALRQAKPLPRDAARLARRYRKLGEAWTRRGQTQRALHAFERALKQDPLDVEVHRQYWALRREALQDDWIEGSPS